MNDFISKIGIEKMIAIGGFLLLVISAFLPWIWFTYLFGGVVTLSGLQVSNGENGMFALLFAVIGCMVLLAYSNMKRCGYMCIGFAIWLFIESAIFYSQSTDSIRKYSGYAGIGAGFYLYVVASSLVLVGGIFLFKVGNIANIPTIHPPTTIEKTGFCGKCGAKLPEGVSFCPICGQKIETSEASSQPTTNQ